MNIETPSVVTPFLELDVQQLPGETTRFVEALTKYLADQTDVTGLKISNLRMMAQWLRMHFERTDGLLEMLEKRDRDPEE